LYCAALWLATLLPTWLDAWVVRVLAFTPSVALILWRFRLLEDSSRHGPVAHGGSFLRLGGWGVVWLAIAMTFNAVAVRELVASEARPARVAVAALVLATGVGLAAIAWIRTGARPRSAS
jgi:hypothetical protein